MKTGLKTIKLNKKNYSNKRQVLLLLLSTTLFACNNGSNANLSTATKQSGLDQHSVQGSNLSSYFLLGAAVHQNGGRDGAAVPATTSCLNMDKFNLEIPAQSPALTVHSSMEYAQSNTEVIGGLSTNSGVKTAYGLFSAYANLKTENLSDLKDSEMRFIYHTTLTAPLAISLKSSEDIGNVPSYLSETGAKLYREGKGSNYGAFIAECGTSYVNTTYIGEKLDYTVTINFNDSETKQMFAVKAGTSYGSFASLATELQKFSSTSGKTYAISMKVERSGIAFSPEKGVESTNFLPKAPPSCLDINTLDQCSTDIADSVNQSTNETIAVIGQITNWLSTNTDKPFDEKRSKFQGMAAFPPETGIETYTQEYHRNVTNFENDDLTKLQTRIYNSIESMNVHYAMIDNLLPVLYSLQVGASEEKFRAKLKKLDNYRTNIRNYADALSAKLSSNDNDLARSCFWDDVIACDNYFKNKNFYLGRTLDETLSQLDKDYESIDLLSAGQYFYTKNLHSNGIGDTAYLGLNEDGEAKMFPISLNYALSKSAENYRRFYSPKLPNKTYLNLAYSNQVVVETKFNSNVPKITLYIDGVSKELTCSVSHREDTIYDCSKGAKAAGDNYLEEMQIDPEALIFYVPDKNKNLADIFKKTFNASLSRSNYHELSPFGAANNAPLRNRPTSTLTVGGEWCSGNDKTETNYCLTLTKNLSAANKYTLSLYNKNNLLDRRVLLDFIPTSKKMVAYMAIGASDVSQGRYQFRFYDASNTLLAQTVDIIDNYNDLEGSKDEIKSEIAFVIDKDGGLYFVNRNAAFKGMYSTGSTGYSIPNTENYNNFNKVITGEQSVVDASFPSLNITNKIKMKI